MSSTSQTHYTVEKLSPFVHCIREVSTNLLMYLIVGDERAVLIDTGSGSGNLYDFIQNQRLLPAKMKLLVINSHNHAEQTGANYQFSANGKAGKSHCVEDLCASGADRKYTLKLDSTFDWQVKPYKITRWLKHGEVVKLGKNANITVHYGPGHTPDATFLVFAADNRLFIGDTFHQFDEILLTYERSSIKQLIQTIGSILKVINESDKPREMRFSASKTDSNSPCLPMLKNYQRFLFSIVAGVQKEIPLRIDEHEGSRFESRDKLMKVVLSRNLMAQLKLARTARDDSSVQSSPAESNSTL
uniref:Lactamase_B domain-containing protein n=1 Tax=Panagrellus redivivus TaxID=6233 RepID=A0A7E4VES9_PANRE